MDINKINKGSAQSDLDPFLTSEIRERGSFYEDSFREGVCFIWLFEERVLSYFIENN